MLSRALFTYRLGKGGGGQSSSYSLACPLSYLVLLCFSHPIGVSVIID